MAWIKIDLDLIAARRLLTFRTWFLKIYYRLGFFSIENVIQTNALNFNSQADRQLNISPNKITLKMLFLYLQCHYFFSKILVSW